MEARVILMSYSDALELLEANGQAHVMQFWDELDTSERQSLLQEIEGVDFPLMRRLIDTWILQTPTPEKFSRIEPVPMIPIVDAARPDAAEACAAGEQALRDGRVGLFLVAGGQGTRLGFSGPKGSYPIGPVSGKSFFEFHAEKIHNLQRRYGCVLPWYIMVSDTNEADTRMFFAAHGSFGLNPEDIIFLRQRMVPCVDDTGRFMLAEKGALAMNPNGHGGCLPAMVENGILADARKRGIDTLCYFQVDNWAVKVADPYFIGYHVLQQADMSSKNHRKQEVRESVGVHCLCDGEYRVIEYSELDLYPQLLELDAQGAIIHAAGNPAIHILSVDFVERLYRHYDDFPWHLAHKKISYLNAEGERVDPARPNGYKFETFVFDALRFIQHPPVALEIASGGEYTPIKQYEGDNSVVAAWDTMSDYWAEWLEAANCSVPRDKAGRVTVRIEISPRYALTKDEFITKIDGHRIKTTKDLGIDPEGRIITSQM